MTGTVYLVGGGPGDPGLLTWRARQLLQEADVIVYDRLVSPRLLSLARNDAKVIYVGKESSRHALPQQDIEKLLVEFAKDGRKVVRLKGGDPFVFGRGGEEALSLNEAGIPWEVVPGISSAVAVPAYAGIPVTHRGISPSFTVVTGHRTVVEELGQVEAAAAGHNGTLVILMGAAQIREIVRLLVDKGRAVETPIAVIRWGTRADQATLIGDLGNIADKVQLAGLKPPAVIVVGDVVRLRDELSWFESKPLFGQRIVIVSETRSQAERMADEMERLGAEVLDVSLEHLWSVRTEKVQRLSSWAQQYGGILFSSRVAVRAFFKEMRCRRMDSRSLVSTRFAAMDSGVESELWAHGIAPEVVFQQSPSRHGMRAIGESGVKQPVDSAFDGTDRITELTRRLKPQIQNSEAMRWIEGITETGRDVFVEQDVALVLPPVWPASKGNVIAETLLVPALESPVLQAVKHFTTDGPFEVVWDLPNENTGFHERTSELLGSVLGVVSFS